MLEVTILSRTVFWQSDLGVEIELIRTMRGNSLLADDMARKFFGPIGAWLEENTKHRYNAYDEGVWFFDAADAALFKLVWADRTPDPRKQSS
jgi:hypothetical protein